MLVKKDKLPINQLITIGILPSPIKKTIYRIMGYKIGKNVKMSFGSVIIGKNVKIGNNTSVGFFSVLRGRNINLGNFIRIGSFVFIDTEKIIIDDDTRINENVRIGGIKFPESEINIGKRVLIMSFSFINPTKPITIGDDTGIGGHCLLFTHSSWLSQLEGFPVKFASINLGKNVWLPWRVFIMPGVEVGDNVVIGANSLVSKSIPSNCLAAGSPAKIIKENYPHALASLERDKILNDIFNEFIRYLEYHHYTINKFNFESGFKLDLQNGRKRKHTLVYSAKIEAVTETQKGNILVQDYFPEENSAQVETSFNMVINLKTKTRSGTSSIGEEFISFISRYGLRFNRLD